MSTDKAERIRAEAMIRTNGFGQTVAFLSQGDPILALLERGLAHHLNGVPLMQAIRNADSTEYLRLTGHALTVVQQGE
jgi:hypothetical protein